MYSLERNHPTEDMLERVKQHMNRSRVPEHLVIELRLEDAELWSNVHVLFATLAPEHICNSERLPQKPSAVRKLKELQKEWGTGTESFAAMIFLPKGTQEFSIEWAMVRPEWFKESPEELLRSLAWAKKNMEENDGDDYYIRSLEFVHAATTGAWPPGDERPAPLKALPSLAAWG